MNSATTAQRLRRVISLALALLPHGLLAQGVPATPELSLSLRTNGAAEISYRGNPGAPYQLERSLNLSQWFPLTEQSSPTPQMSWLDAAPFQPASFYRVRATARPFTAAQLAAAADYSRVRGGSSVVVMQHEALVFEDYHNGADTNTAAHIHSATKVFWACALAAAIQDGLISGYDEPVFQTITEWQTNTLHPAKRLITVGHLATLSSGLSQDVDYIQGTDPLADDIYDYVVNNLRVNYYPGTMFEYGPSHYYAFGVLLQRKLALAGTPMNPLQYLQARILTPLGIEYVNWTHDVAGNPHIPNGCTLTPRNWIKLGQFILQRGWWNGREVVASARMAELRVATGPNPGHGKFLWLNQPGGYPPAGVPLPPPGIPGGFIYYDGYTDILGALGAGKVRMYVIPSLNAVVARQTLLETDAFQDTDFLATLLVD